jgi:hypothetical protein
VKEIYILMMIHYRPCNSKWSHTRDRLHRCSLLSEQYITSKPLLANHVKCMCQNDLGD